MKVPNSINHPFAKLNIRSNKFMGWVADRVLASPVMFYSALVTPLLILPAPSWAKSTLVIISSNWIQWWALPALQRRQNELDTKADLKADADHEALMHLSDRLSTIERGLIDIKSLLTFIRRS